MKNSEGLDIRDGIVYGDGICTDINIVIPSAVGKYAVTEIADSAFCNCRGLESVTIPDSVTKIGNNAFGFCSELSSITISDSVVEIGDDAFIGCFGLSDELGFCVLRNVLYSYYGSDKNVTVPYGITKIGTYAFCACSELKSITIPNSVTQIGENAFCACENLASVNIPSSVTEIGEHAFHCCEGLENIIIPDSVIKIGEHAFDYCSLLTIHGTRGSTAEIYAKQNNIPFVEG